MALDLSVLNDEQLPPVMHTEGAVLVTAGAGSGKTRLLTHRIAHLMCNLKIPAYNILAITFTNKSAREMKERLSKMIDGADELFVSTFHSMCVTILRKFIHKIGFSRSFSIYDEDEKKKVIKRIAAEIDPNSDTLASGIYLALSRIKNAGQTAEWYKDTYKFIPDVDNIALGALEYQKEMKICDALDFDDLLLYTLELLIADSEAREYYQKKFRYIHIDEFQDTNIIQYRIVKILGGCHGNIFAVGDEDQSIYGWRGANIENIRDFMNDFDCTMYKLEQNYRSSKSILQLANSVIKNNSSRIEKNLWTENDEGFKPQLYQAATDSEEADFVMQTVSSLRDRGNQLKSMAVLMRVNALSRSIEQKFMFYNIPYRLYGGFKFYDRKEIKDVMAYLKLLVNHKDNEAAGRVIAFPKKGIGETSVQKLINASREYNLSIFDIIVSMAENSAVDAENKEKIIDLNMVKSALGNALCQKLKPLAAQLKKLDENKNLKVSNLLKFLYNLIDLQSVFGGGTEDDENRLLNARELINSVMQTEDNNPDMTLEEYVQQVMLLSDLDAESEGDAVNLFTVHSAKGLEFDTVFIIGAEDGLFPLARAMDNPDELEEERRLMYVALTRAKKRLYISHTRRRFMYGRHTNTMPSRFLFESGILKEKKSLPFVGGGIKDPRPDFKAGLVAAPKLGNDGVDINQLKVGMEIRHKRLGKGIIKSVDTATRQAEVEFETIGVLLLSVDFAPIKIIE